METLMIVSVALAVIAVAMVAGIILSALSLADQVREYRRAKQDCAAQCRKARYRVKVIQQGGTAAAESDAEIHELYDVEGRP